MDLGSHIQWGIGAGVSIALWQQYMYETKLPENIDAFRELLQDYAKLPPEEVDSHLCQIVSYDHRPIPACLARGKHHPQDPKSAAGARSAHRISYQWVLTAAKAR